MSLHFFRKFLIGSALAVGGVGFLLGLFGPWLSQLDVLAHFRLHFLCVLITGLSVLFAPRHGFRILLLGGVITLGLHPLIAWLDHPWQAIRAHADDAARSHLVNYQRIKSAGIKSQGTKSQGIKIISLNSWHRHADHQQLISYLHDQDADIVVLGEFGPNKRYLLKTLRRRYPNQADCAHIWSCSIALLSKFEFSSQGADKPSRDRPSHVWGTFNVGGQKLSVIGTHLYRPIDDLKRHRREISGLAEHVRNLDGAIVVVGDFNTTPWAHSFRTFRTESQLTAMNSYLPSWPAVAPQLAIDHLFHSENVRVRSVRTGGAMGSDHLPLVAHIELNSAGGKTLNRVAVH